MDIATALTEPIAPMEATLVSALPDGAGWQFEPKWDGFRAITVRDGDAVTIWSKSGNRWIAIFPSLRRGFDSLHPLQKALEILGFRSCAPDFCGQDSERVTRG